jgi:hypothetical protein
LFHDIKHRGYTGSFSNLECLLAAWRRAEKPEKEKGDAAPAWIGRTGRTYDNAPVRDPQTSHLGDVRLTWAEGFAAISL